MRHNGPTQDSVPAGYEVRLSGRNEAMAAFDRLSPRIRRAINYAPFKISPVSAIGADLDEFEAWVAGMWRKLGAEPLE